MLMQPVNYDFGVMFTSISLQINRTGRPAGHILKLCYGRDISVTDVTNMGIGILGDPKTQIPKLLFKMKEGHITNFHA